MPAPVESHNDPDSPAWTSPAYRDAAEAWQDCRAAAAGTRAIRQGRTRYLPQNPAEEARDYRDRLATTEFFNGFGRTVDAMAGLVFQADPTLGADADAETAREWENIDGAGTHGAVFLKRVYLDGMTTGRAGILVDFPSTAPGLSLAEEQRRRARPYWIHVQAEQVLSWRLGRDGAETVFTQLVVREVVEREHGAFGSVPVVRWRVYRRLPGPADPVTGQPTVGRTVYWQVWEHPDKGQRQKPVVVRSGVLRGVTAIPFAPFCPASDGDVWGGPPPLLDLLDVNLAHYRVTGDRRYALHLTCAPTPVWTGWTLSQRTGGDGDGEGQNSDTDRPIELGPNRGQRLAGEADFKWVAPPPDWAEPSERELKMLEGRMAALGLSMLQHETRDAETAEGQRIHRAGQNATLAGSARELKDAGERAHQFHAAFAQRKPAGLTVNTDFEQIVMTPEEMAAYSDLVFKGQLSLDELWAMLKKGHRLSSDFNPKTEKARIANSPGVSDGGDLTGDDEDDNEDEREERDDVDARPAPARAAA
jgi:hypothetical protein